MSQLSVFVAASPEAPLRQTHDPQTIAEWLGEVGVTFEQWTPRVDVQPGDPEDQVLAAFAPDIERLKEQGGYVTADVISLAPDNPDRVAIREKFLSEHTHAEDEVRFFVAGQGLFSLHLGDEVYQVLCTKGDLISVPAGTRHWFDTGPEPSLTAVRIFTNPEGWVARYTGDTIADGFPRLDA